jgi:site-specific DNA-methyltransferase (adenine-specific)
MTTTPYYDEDGITIYCGDAREILPTLQADLLVTDPPYGCNATTGWGGKYDGFSIINDKDTEARDWVLSQWDGSFIMFGSPKIQQPKCKARLIWWKGEHTGMGDLSFPWKPDYEDIYVGGYGFAGPRTSSILRFNARTDSGRYHPTEKPIPLMSELISKSPGKIILDPFMGSGSTLVSAKLNNRQSIGIEIEERYCETAANRLAQEVFDFA